MGWISLENMSFYAHHGYYPEEQIIGAKYRVDVSIQASFEEAAATDDLEQTINYETVFMACQLEMRKPAKLIEHVAMRIIQRLQFQFDQLQAAQITIRKEHPPLGGEVEAASINMTFNWVKTCPKCGSGFSCYGSGNCWCGKYQISTKTREHLNAQFSGCLCENCLSEYSI